mgnify:CR=1 FL=1|jgi:hypothetical protein
MAVVAVFETHMERNAEAPIRLSTTLPGLAAMRPRVKIHRAMRRSKPHFCIAPAIKNPERKRKITGFA